MLLVVSRLAAAIDDFDGTDNNAGRQIAWMNAHPFELFGGAGLAAGVNVNALANYRWSTAILNLLVPRKICSA
jgi:hypothetical protein